MSALLAPLGGLLGVHLLGALLGALGTRRWGSAVRSPSSAWLGLAALYILSLGLTGFGLAAALALGAALAVATVLGRPEPGPRLPAAAWLVLLALAAVVLARPWTPTMWDELVWLGKARLESLGFGTEVRAALDPAQRLVPPGYPTLWPAAVGWLSLGQDDLAAQVVAGSLLMLLAAAAALEAWWPLMEGTPRGAALAVLVSSPLMLVHLRSVYLDLQVGLLALALLGHLVQAARRPQLGPAPAALALAVVLPALKDEGLAHALAASAAVVWAARGIPGTERRLLPAALALASVVAWRAVARVHGVENVDHSLATPLWRWAPTLAALLAEHATDVFTWGLFWPVVGAAVVAGRRQEVGDGALKALLGLTVVLLSLALLTGPERVRVFAENGTLLNRLLMQLWPGAALLLLRELAPAEEEPTGSG